MHTKSVYSNSVCRSARLDRKKVIKWNGRNSDRTLLYCRNCLNRNASIGLWMATFGISTRRRRRRRHSHIISNSICGEQLKWPSVETRDMSERVGPPPSRPARSRWVAKRPAGARERKNAFTGLDSWLYMQMNVFDYVSVLICVLWPSQTTNEILAYLRTE